MINLHNLEKLLEKRNSKSKLSEATGISTGNISDWFNPHRKSSPNAESLIKIARYFNCSVDYLLGLTDIKDINTKLHFQKPPTIIYRFPVYNQQAAAGAGKYGRESKYEMEDIIIDNPSHKAVFGVRISGDSMESDKKDSIQDKAIVLLNPNFDEADLEGRAVVFVIKETGEVLCKKFYPKHDHIEFISANNERQNLNRILKPDKYIIIGEVVEIINPR